MPLSKTGKHVLSSIIHCLCCDEYPYASVCGCRYIYITVIISVYVRRRAPHTHTHTFSALVETVVVVGCIFLHMSQRKRRHADETDQIHEPALKKASNQIHEPALRKASDRTDVCTPEALQNTIYVRARAHCSMLQHCKSTIITTPRLFVLSVFKNRKPSLSSSSTSSSSSQPQIQPLPLPLPTSLSSSSSSPPSSGNTPTNPAATFDGVEYDPYRRRLRIWRGPFVAADEDKWCVWRPKGSVFFTLIKYDKTTTILFSHEDNMFYNCHSDVCLSAQCPVGTCLLAQYTLDSQPTSDALLPRLLVFDLLQDGQVPYMHQPPPVRYKRLRKVRAVFRIFRFCTSFVVRVYFIVQLDFIIQD